MIVSENSAPKETSDPFNLIKSQISQTKCYPCYSSHEKRMETDWVTARKKLNVAIDES